MKFRAILPLLVVLLSPVLAAQDLQSVSPELVDGRLLTDPKHNLRVELPDDGWQWHSLPMAASGFPGVTYVALEPATGARFLVSASSANRAIDPGFTTGFFIGFRRSAKESGLTIRNLKHERSDVPFPDSRRFTCQAVSASGETIHWFGYIASAEKVFVFQHLSAESKEDPRFTAFVRSFDPPRPPARRDSRKPLLAWSNLGKRIAPWAAGIIAVLVVAGFLLNAMRPSSPETAPRGLSPLATGGLTLGVILLLFAALLGTQFIMKAPQKQRLARVRADLMMQLGTIAQSHKDLDAVRARLTTMERDMASLRSDVAAARDLYEEDFPPALREALEAQKRLEGLEDEYRRQLESEKQLFLQYRRQVTAYNLAAAEAGALIDRADTYWLVVPIRLGHTAKPVLQAAE
ncbi:MAG: hypothetical protein ACYC7A_10365 [Thermoanaerobaculia bacterium]